MIVERGRGNEVIVRYRDESGVRKEQKLSAQPFCFVEKKDFPHKITRPFTSEPGYRGLYGEDLMKATFTSTDDMREGVKGLRTWEANINHANRVLIENDSQFPMYQHRVCYFDMEWMIESGQITIIVVHDSEDGEYVFFTHSDYKAGFYDTIPCANHPEGLESVKSGERRFKCFNDEKSMLLDFARLLRKNDYDIITGWNVVNADIQQLFKRFKANDLQANLLSPMKRVRYDFKEWGQPIVGTNVIDLMIAFPKLWTLKNGQLPAKSLGAVSAHCLGDTKVELPDGHDTYFTDFGTYLDYARQDVRLLPRLDSLVGALNYFIAVQHITQCDLRTTPYITKVFPVLALRDPDFGLRIPTKPQFEKVDYQGADIQTADPGVYDNIAIMDIKAMYHSNVKLHNICWTNLDDEGVDCGNGVRFAQRDGLLGRQMDKMTTLRNEYKRKMKEATDEEERKMYDALQYATKSLVASMYGVAGDSKCGFYHPDIAASITHTSRQTLFRLRDECEALGMPAIYGHTDSVFVQCDTPEKGVEALRTINENMAPIETEFEKWSSAFLLMAKNRYAGLVSWTDGAYHDAQMYVKGIEMKQSRLPKAMKEAMSTVVGGILRKDDSEHIVAGLEDLVRRTVAQEIPVADLCIKAKLSKDLSQYTTLGEARAGAHWANTHLGKGYRKDDYFLTTLDDKGDYIAFDDPSEIEGIAQVGHRHLAERFIVEKVRPYFEVMSWDIMRIENALNGLSDMGWL